MRRLVLPVALILLTSTAAVLADEGTGGKSAASKKGAGEAGAAALPRALIKTSMGDIEVELLARAAPKTVALFLGLAEGKGTFTDARNPKKQVTITKPFYDGLTFHRVVPGFMLQGGCPKANGQGDAGFAHADEMNATALGLDKLKVVSNGRTHPWLGIGSQQDFNQRIVTPVARALGIRSQEEFAKRVGELQRKVDSLSLKDYYEILGFRYSTTLPSVKPTRGTLALANTGRPNTNGSQFFINVGDPAWLTGKHTVFGRVTKGMDVVDKIAAVKTTGPKGKPANKPLEPVKILSIRALK